MENSPKETSLGFCRRYRLPVAAAFLFTLLAFGYMLTRYSLSIDEEIHLQGSPSPLFWLTQGRFGIYALNLLISPDGRFIPVLWDWLATAVWFAAAVVMLLSFRPFFPHPRKFEAFVFLAYCSCLPFSTGEIMSYSMSNLQICVGMLCASAACLLSARYKATPGKGLLIAAAALLCFAVSIYETFASVYVTWVAAAALFEFLLRKKRLREVLRAAVPLAVLCFASVLVYGIINLLISRYVVPSGGYIAGNYIGWGKESSAWKALFMALANVVRVSFGLTIYGYEVYGGIALAATTCAFCAVVLYRMARMREKGERWPAFALTVCAVCAPFVIFIALGAYNAHGRSLLALPVLGAAQWLFVLHTLQGRGIGRWAAVGAALVLAYNAAQTHLLYVDAQKVYENDRAAVQAIAEVCEQKGYSFHEKPLAFVGMYDSSGGEKLRQTGACGGSHFTWDDGVNQRLVSFFRAEGIPVRGASPEQIAEALPTALALPAWPDPGSVQDAGDCVVVHLSEPTEKWRQLHLPPNRPAP